MLSGEELETLRRWATRPSASRDLPCRARLALASAAGHSDALAASRVRQRDLAMGSWRDWFSAEGGDRSSNRGAASDSHEPGGRKKLTSRERELLALLGQGRSNQKIAAALGVSESAVQHHVRSILEKLHLKNRVQAVVFAVCHGMGDEPSGASP